MEKNNELFTTMPVGRAVAKLAVPTVVSQIIVILYSLADTFFIGQIGDPNQLAALSITFPIYTLLTAIANLFGIGANSVIARSLGQNDESIAKKSIFLLLLGQYHCNRYFICPTCHFYAAGFAFLRRRQFYVWFYQ